jgi:hypothetical protein
MPTVRAQTIPLWIFSAIGPWSARPLMTAELMETNPDRSPVCVLLPEMFHAE